ncbi:MAG: tRNA (N6-isopentenyl adenosine(37)-C2)-methylthiotransferase MiaB [candidate division WOR-3 bacterium]
MNNKYYIQTYGCQMNLYEEGIVCAIMNRANYTRVDNEYEADIIFLITCAVRAHAEQRVLGRLNVLKHLKHSKPDLIIGILGCLAQNYQNLFNSNDGVDLVVGPDQYRKLPELIADFQRTKTKQICCELTLENYEGIIPKTPSKVTGFVSIMRGCNNYCAYCIVPYVRGRERSKSKQQILTEIENLIENGVKDITLVGQNVLAWHDGSLNFLDLLKIIDKIDGFERLRFITSHPKDLTQEHLIVFSSLKKFCPQLHLPLQSGSNRILQLMNRKYTKEEYLAKIEFARKLMPEISLTTDVMVGFPTETEQDFYETYEVMQKIQFDYAYLFKYSERPYTKALALYPKVDKVVSQNRLERLIELQNKITKQKSQQYHNKVVEVLIESHNGKQSLGRTKNNKVVIINEIVDVGKLYQCRIKAVSGWTPIGEIIRTDEQIATKDNIVNNCSSPNKKEEM